ncbi:MAG: class I SAM-dependent methyltransferase [Anaeroplasmataceae bacterium]
MSERNMTALVSCFVRCYHYKFNKYRIFSDNIALNILSKEEYNSIASNMTKGIGFFNPYFVGTNEEALRWIIDNQLSPSVLGRSAFCEEELMNAIKNGCGQYLIYAAGYDTFAYRNKFDNLKIFEIDREEMINDKIRRLDSAKLDYSRVDFISCDFTNGDWINNIICSNYEANKISFNSLLGISYYLRKEEFISTIEKISSIICSKSSLLFDYPNYEDSKETKTNELLANEADEPMKSKYLYSEIEDLLSRNGFLICKHLDDREMTNIYFREYNLVNYNNKIIAPKGVSYCLAIKK